MRSKSLVTIVILLALGAVGWLLWSNGALDGVLGLSHKGGESGESGTLKGGANAADAKPGEAAAPSTGKTPHLFGSGLAPRVGKGSLRGRVLDVRTGKPVEKAVLSLAGRGFGREDVSLQVATGPEGTFQMLEVPAGGGYGLTLAAPGQTGRTIPGVGIEASAVRDLGDLWLGKTGLLEGVVLDPSGQPVVGAEVALHRGLQSLTEFFRSGGFIDFFTNMDREPEPLAKTQSQAGGKFRFEAVSPGPTALLVRAAGFRQAIVPLTFTGEGQRESVTVRLAGGSVIAGKVVDTEGRGLAGVHLAAFSEEGGMPSPLARTFATSEAGGAFRFANLPGEGRQMLVAALDGYPNAFAQTKAGDTDVKVTMARGATVEVKLLSEGNDAPIPNAQVVVAVGEKAEMRGDAPGTLVAGMTDATGSAVLDLRPGVLQIVIASSPDLPPMVWMAAQRGPMPGMLHGPDDANVPTGRSTKTFHAPRGTRLSGRVTDLDGHPLAGVEVTNLGFLGKAGSAVSDAEGQFELAAATEMSMGLMATLPGWVQDSMDRPDKTSSEGEPPREVHMNIKMRRAASVAGHVLGPDDKPVGGASVYVTPVREGGGFDVSAMFATPANSISLADGSFLVDGVPSGRKVKVVARREGFVDGGTEAFEVPVTGAPTPQEVHLLAGGSVEVRVEGADGQPVSGARVQPVVARNDGVSLDRFEDMVQRSSGQNDYRTGADGKVVATLLPPGPLTVTVHAAGHAPGGARTDISAAGGPKEPLVVRLKEGMVLEGTVLDGEGKPISGAQVRALNPPRTPPGPGEANLSDGSDEWNNEWDENRRTSTDAEGKWRLADLTERSYRLQATADGHRSKTLDPGTQRRDIQIRLVVQDPEAQKRIETIDKELQGLYQQMGSVKGDERQKLIERLQALQKERQDLAGE